MCNRPSCATEAGSALTLTSLGFTYLSFVTSYALVIGSLYNIAYWSTFGINAFQYAGLTELATSAFQFMLWIAGATAVGVVFGDRYWGSDDAIEVNTAVYLLQPSMLFPFIFLLCLSLIQGHGWFLLIGVGLAFLPALLQFMSRLNLASTSPRLQRLILTFLVLTTTGVFALGKERAYEIKHNKEYLSTTLAGERVKFLGHIEGNNFFLEMHSDSIVIITNPPNFKLEKDGIGLPSWLSLRWRRFMSVMQ